MGDCCSLAGCAKSHPRKLPCPANGRKYSGVSARTIACHIQKAWAWTQTATHYFFCEDPGCDVVYFGDDGSTINTSQLRTRIGAKEISDDGPLCYCFGVSKADYLLDPAIKDFVIAQTKAGLCSCETSNPSGRCCLKDFPKPARLD